VAYSFYLHANIVSLFVNDSYQCEIWGSCSGLVED